VDGAKTPAWKKSRIWNHVRDVAFLSTFLALTAIPLTVLKVLRKWFDEPLLWNVLSTIDGLGTVMIFSLFWAVIVVRLFGELKLQKGVQGNEQAGTVPND
jgi:hypothetical protein